MPHSSVNWNNRPWKCAVIASQLLKGNNCNTKPVCDITTELLQNERAWAPSVEVKLLLKCNIHPTPQFTSIL